jgi:tetratricopeptide (TPR) repeat protein
VTLVAPVTTAADLADATTLFRTGKYAETIDACKQAIDDRQWGESWWLLKIRAELATGQYEQALKTYETALGRYDTVTVRLLGFEVLRANDRPADADALLASIREGAERTPWRYTEAASRVGLGRVLLQSGADARQVLELFYDKAKKESPDAVEPYTAIGDLSLEKHDYAMAAEAFTAAAKRTPDDPDVHFGLARAYDNDGERVTAALNKALELNPRHADSLLYKADNLIDREDYAGAEWLLKAVLDVNPKHPRAWAYRAVLAHLAGDAKQEAAHRTAALASWSTNPDVDHLIGLKLSQKYRFAEGAAYQRKSLEFSATHRPAKVQLCQDLLRLGKEEEGWRLAGEVFKEDQYNVVTYNLVTLQEQIAKFRTLRDEHTVVRMDEREAQIYGQRVMRLLARAREKLASKYGVTFAEPVTVEIFPRQQDFAIRTFGLPGGDGFLGVCFGPLITVNSPASRAARPANWEAILWHEYCHSVTLHKTRNKMPRWLSEGISVYEERQESPGWGQAMSPRYRELIKAGGATPVSKLSGAFLKPPSPMHLQFAYYESSMVVEYVLNRFGAPALQKVLDDLGKDLPINEALAKHTEPIDRLDANFAKWLTEQADALGSKGIDWTQPKLPLDADSTAVKAWNQEHPDNFYGLLSEGRALVAEQKWQDAKSPLEKAIKLYPSYGEAGGPYLLLAAVHRELKDAKAEREMLEKHAALDADAIEPRLRLIELAQEAKDWPAVRRLAEQVLAVNPLVPQPHRALVKAAEALGERSVAIEGHRTLLMLDPLDRAEHHYHLARLLADERQLPAARKEVVRALEEAPRYRAAHQLLLSIADQMGPTTRPATATTAPVAPSGPPAPPSAGPVPAAAAPESPTKVSPP